MTTTAPKSTSKLSTGSAELCRMAKGALGMSFGAGTTPAGNTQVAFSCSYPDLRLEPTAANGQRALEAMRAFALTHFKEIRQLVFHDWNNYEFALGTLEFLRPGMATIYLDV
ncbi:hypothetical protein DL767_007380 [Monosporascus sp. MG133]|nr:hypothetical protein DL767_007380 [Monosporascus sp. MG133]